MQRLSSSLQQRAFEKAHDCLIAGWNCSQSVLLTMQELLDLPDHEVLKAATGFGGGIGNVGSLCGALTGGVMALGLLYGRGELSESAQKETTYFACAQWYDRFVGAMGGCNCSDILMVDLRDPVVRKEYWRNAQNRERCASQIVGTAARLLMVLVEETGTRPGGAITAASQSSPENEGS